MVDWRTLSQTRQREQGLQGAYATTATLPLEFSYQPNRFLYNINPMSGKVEQYIRPEVREREEQERQAEARQRQLSAMKSYGYSQYNSAPLPILTSEQPTPRLLPSERREIAEGAVMRGFSPVSRGAPPRIASKIAGDVEEGMMEQQQQRIRDQIISEMLSLYMSPRRYSDPLQLENLQRQLAMLDEMYERGGA